MSRGTPFHSFLFLVACLVVGSCGPVRPPDPEPTAVLLLSVPELDGYVRSDGSFGASGGPPVTGDLDGVANGLGVRQFYSYDLSDIPAGSTILEADVAFVQVNCVGSPYDTLGSLRIEHVTYGPSLDASDFDVPTLRDEGGLIVASCNDTQSGRGLDVYASVQEDLDSGRGLSQFRLRFELFDSDLDGESDYVVFTDAELTTGARLSERPRLQVLYLPPR